MAGDIDKVLRANSSGYAASPLRSRPRATLASLSLRPMMPLVLAPRLLVIGPSIPLRAPSVVLRVERQPVLVTALERHTRATRAVNGAGFRVVAGLAERHQPLERREGIATFRDSDDMIDVGSYPVLAPYKALLAEGLVPELPRAQEFPLRRVVGPLRH